MKSIYSEKPVAPNAFSVPEEQIGYNRNRLLRTKMSVCRRSLSGLRCNSTKTTGFHRDIFRFEAFNKKLVSDK